MVWDRHSMWQIGMTKMMRAFSLLYCEHFYTYTFYKTQKTLSYDAYMTSFLYRSLTVYLLKIGRWNVARNEIRAIDITWKRVFCEFLLLSITEFCSADVLCQLAHKKKKRREKQTNKNTRQFMGTITYCDNMCTWNSTEQTWN